MLTSRRIQLRPFRPEERELYVSWFTDRDTMLGAFQPYRLGLAEEIRQRFGEKLTPDDTSGRLAIGRLEDDRVIGLVRYGRHIIIPTVAEFYEIGYAITDPALRRQGYATEACALLIDYLFGLYPVERIGAFTTAGNLPSIGLLQKFGFQLEGTIRHGMFLDGAWTDVVMYGLLRSEWATSHP